MSSHSKHVGEMVGSVDDGDNVGSATGIRVGGGEVLVGDTGGNGEITGPFFDLDRFDSFVPFFEFDILLFLRFFDPLDFFPLLFDPMDFLLFD